MSSLKMQYHIQIYVSQENAPYPFPPGLDRGSVVFLILPIIVFFLCNQQGSFFTVPFLQGLSYIHVLRLELR